MRTLKLVTLVLLQAAVMLGPLSVSFAQTVSGSYKLDPSQSSISFTDDPMTGYGINVFLKDSQSGEVIIDQTGVDYTWTSEDTSVVVITQVNHQCVDPVQPPCPKMNGQMAGLKAGNTKVKVVAKKDGATLAETSISVEVKSSGLRPSPSPTPSPSPSPSPSPTPSPSPSPKVSPSPSPRVSPSPVVSPSPSVSPSPVSPISPRPSPSPSSSSNARDTSGMGLLALIIVGVVIGLGVPIAWYTIESNPALKAKALGMRNRFFKKSPPEDLPPLM